MKSSTSTTIPIALFIAATFLLVSYLLSESWQIYFPVPLFWVAIALMISTITIQILKAKPSPFKTKILLIEIVVTSFALHLIYVIPYYGLSGSDPYGDFASAKGILSSGFVLGNPSYVNIYSKFPLIHIFGDALSMTSSIDLFTVARWVPSLIDTLIVPLMFLLTKTIFKEEKVALLSALLFACLQNHVSFGAGFIRETFGLIMAVSCLYLYFSASRSKHPTSKYVMSIIFLIATIFAHHLTSFMLLTIFLIHLIVIKASQIPFLRRNYFNSNIVGESITGKYVLIASIALLSFWTIVVNYPLSTLVSILRSVFTLGQYGDQSYVEISGMSDPSSIATLRGNILFYGFFFFLAIFSLILLYTILPKRKNYRVETYSFTLFLLLCFSLGFIGLYLISIGAYPDRFLTYGWFLGFPPLVLAILKVKFKYLQKIGVILLVAFMLFNVYMIDPSYWNAKTEQVTSVSPTLEDYSIANTLNVSGTIIGPGKTVLAMYDIHNNLGTYIPYNEEIDLASYDWIIINKPELELEKSWFPDSKMIILLEQLAYGSSLEWNKIIESDNLVVLKAASS